MEDENQETSALESSEVPSTAAVTVSSVDTQPVETGSSTGSVTANVEVTTEPPVGTSAGHWSEAPKPLEDSVNEVVSGRPLSQILHYLAKNNQYTIQERQALRRFINELK